MSHDKYLLSEYWDTRNTVLKNQTVSFSDEIKHYVINRKISIANYFINLLHPKTIMDVGCGAGYISGVLADIHKDKNFYLVDFSKENLKKVPEKENIEICLATCWDIPYDDKSIDFLFSFDVLCHLTTLQVGKTLLEINRVAKNVFTYFTGQEISPIISYSFLFKKLRIPSKKIRDKLILYYTRKNEIPFNLLRFYRSNEK